MQGPEEAVSIADAIRMHTLEPAYFTFEESTRGSITPGKVADFVVLNVDPFATAPDAIKDIKIDRVVIGGRELIKS